MGAYTKMAFASPSPAAEAAAILRAYDFSAVTSLADIGGEGALVPALRQAQPKLRALVFDLESALGGSAPLCEDGKVKAGSDEFFAGIPAGYDAYLLDRVVSQWHDRAAVCILRNCRAAMAPHSRLLMVERIAPRAFDNDGLRTACGYEALLQAAGLVLTRIVPTAAQPSVIEAIPRVV
jgi:hypothetical protein